MLTRLVRPISFGKTLIRGVFTVSEKEYDARADHSLDKLSEYFDHISDNFQVSDNFDVNYSYGVLTVAVSKEVGTYVINKQSPNKQIWLSSPFSGPKRYDLTQEFRWIYNTDKVYLDDLLNDEFRKIFPNENIDFSKHI